MYTNISTYVGRSACILCLAGRSGPQFTATLHNVSILPSTDPHNHHSNIQYSFLSMCRLQQLAMPSRLTVVLVSLLLATPALILWLWLVIVPARVAILCPEECHCDTGGYFVECVGTSLNPIPLIHLTDVRVLWLLRNKIIFLETDSFVSITELEVLAISWCELRTIELGAFNGLTKLTKLTIQHNDISEILPGTFGSMKSLQFLSLNNNRLKHVENALFIGLVNLNHIELGGNKLRNFHPDTFLGLPKLQELYIFSNRRLQIPTDRNFINSHSLSHFDISSCNISSLSFETFSNVSALERLDLSDNNLRTVDINILRALPELSELSLEGNPLQCDCQLQEVWRWCEDRNIQTATWAIVPECGTPSEVEGMWWGVLEKGECLEGNIQYYGDYKNTSYGESDIGEHKYEYDEYDDEFLNQYQVPVYAVPFIFGTTSNVMLLIIIICNKHMRTLPNMYILNMAISDIIYLTVHFFEACASRISNTWLKGDFMCRFLPNCRRLSIGLSA